MNVFLLSVWAWKENIFGIGSTFCTWARRMVKTDLTRGLSQALELRLQSFEVFPCLYREAMHLQWLFPSTRYVGGVTTRAHERNDFCYNWSWSCLLALHGSIIINYVVVSGQFFSSCLVCELVEKNLVCVPGYGKTLHMGFFLVDTLYHRVKTRVQVLGWSRASLWRYSALFAIAPHPQ